MLHEPASQSGPDPAADYKTKLGVIMFLLYCVIYAGFVLLTVLTEGRAMQVVSLGGLNIAVLYGMGLIIFALILALIYSAMCTAKERELGVGPTAAPAPQQPATNNDDEEARS
ncbi:MAG: DUF485 domain-containing protein [Planctomycetota bacterium]